VLAQRPAQTSDLTLGQAERRRRAAHPAQIVVPDHVAESVAKSAGYVPSIGPRSPSMHLDQDTEK